MSDVTSAKPLPGRAGVMAHPARRLCRVSPWLREACLRQLLNPFAAVEPNMGSLITSPWSVVGRKRR